TADFVRQVLFSNFKGSRVVDADGLNILAGTKNWWQKLAGDAILTPHPGEMSRLSGMTVAVVQADRVNTTRKLAGEWGKTVVLKGAYTVVAAPDGRCRLSPFANAGLASAGTGDVLTGAIAGLAAQGLSLFAAASLGVYLHGAAGEMVRAELGDTGMIASDLLPALPRTIRQLKRKD
ncbi:MAG: NAD(P)H-hydrate dehydratase, partial [Chloroflexota bacterium]